MSEGESGKQAGREGGREGMSVRELERKGDVTSSQQPIRHREAERV